MRKEDRFLSPAAATEKQSLINDDYDADEMTAKCDEFFGDSFFCSQYGHILIPKCK